MTGPVVAGAAFTLPAGGELDTVVLTVASSDVAPLRCASLLKPLYFWAAGHLPGIGQDDQRWAAAARPGVLLSANTSTVHVWQSCGAEALLEVIAHLTGVQWRTDPAGPPAFGRVLVRAEEVAQAYAALAVAARTDHRRARPLLTWMRAVDEEQTMGARPAAAAALHVSSNAVAVKCGWFHDSDETVLRTHAVTVTPFPDGTVRGTAVLTAVPLTAIERADYRRVYVHGPEVLPLHQELAGPLIATATYDLLAP